MLRLMQGNSTSLCGSTKILFEFVSLMRIRRFCSHTKQKGVTPSQWKSCVLLHGEKCSSSMMDQSSPVNSWSPVLMPSQLAKLCRRLTLLFGNNSDSDLCLSTFHFFPSSVDFSDSKTAWPSFFCCFFFLQYIEVTLCTGVIFFPLVWFCRIQVGGVAVHS